MALLPLAFSLHAIARGVRVFFDHLADVNWNYLSIVIGLQVLKIGCAAKAWQNSVVASYPGKRVRFPTVFGAFSAGTAVGTVIPAHGGDAVRIVMVKRRVPSSTYTTITSTLLVRAPVDTLIGISFFIFLFSQGVLPGRKLLPHRPAFDFSWFFGHPKEAVIVVGSIVLILTALLFWAWVAIQEFKQRVRQGINGLLDWRFYLRRILPWQLSDWLLRIVIIYFALLAFNMPATVYNSLLAQATSGLSTLLPISPSGIGTEQALLVTVLHGVAPGTMIVAYSVGTRLITSLVNVVLGFAAILFFFRTFHFRRYVDAERESAKAESSSSRSRSP